MCHSHGSQGESAQKNENDKHKDGVKVKQMMDLHDFTAVLPVCIFSSTGIQLGFVKRSCHC
jgi:hypothetical protein